MLVQAPYGIVELKKCEVCKALLEQEDVYAHRDWHKRIEEQMMPLHVIT